MSLPYPSLSPEKFIYEKYACKMGVAHTEIFSSTFSYKILPSVTVIGYCDATRLAVNSRENGYAIMVELEDGEETWLHYDPSWPMGD